MFSLYNEIIPHGYSRKGDRMMKKLIKNIEHAVYAEERFKMLLIVSFPG